MKRKRILFIINSISGGGAERIMQDLLAGLDKNEFELFLYVLYWTGEEHSLVPGHVKYFIGSPRTIYAPFFNLIHLSWVFLRVNPGLVVSFLWQANILSAFVAFLTGKKLFLAEHTLPEFCMKQYGMRMFRKLLLTAAYKSADKVITVSDNAKKSAVKYFDLRDDKVVVIENGINVAKIQKFSDEKIEVPFAEYVISAGRLEPMHKNFSFLLDIIYLLKLKNNIDIPLVILGEGKDRKDLEKKAADLGIRIFLPGFIENPYALIKRAKVFAVTSNYESFHLGIIEAMACGTPVVSVSCPGGISGLIRSFENGILVEPGDADAFAAAVAKLLSDSGLARKFTEAGRSMVENKYNIQLMVGKYGALLR